jgi:hypothetical protein
VHRGQVLERVVKQSSFNIKNVIARMNISRTTYYNHINNKDLSIDIIAKYGRAIGYDFSSEFPEIKRAEAFIKAKEPKTFEEAMLERNMWREKYYDVLEKYNNCMERLAPPNKD